MAAIAFLIRRLGEWGSMLRPYKGNSFHSRASCEMVAEASHKYVCGAKGFSSGAKSPITVRF